ncbi:hypothetical protein [Bradyrhizobium sp.]|uniref:hypothetical protein n=1 Tax=Bradyrhizobium sp. TaxID=376 RepID=UPI0025BEFD30|nr:hypothetical protein [Bradyrhizobium sp.]
METNFIALVPSFKFEPDPTFVLACDAIGLRLLRDSFLELENAEPETFFVVGDGVKMASDERCRLTIVRASVGEESEILRSNQSECIWRIARSDAVTIAAKLLSLFESNIPGHQYLEVERGRYRTVVVTKDEYPVGTIRAMRDGRAPSKG